MLKKTLKSNYFLPSSFLQPQNLLFLNTPESEFYTYLQEAHRLVCREPVILEMIESDLDSLSKEKKRFRLLDKKWELSQSGQLPNIDITLFDGEIKADELRLQGGRKRMESYLVYMFLLIRGFWSGVKCSEFKLLLLESKTMELFLSSYNEGKMPGFSTISENINGVSNKTREFIFDAQIRMIIEEGLDDFQELTIDSTSVSGNSCWPTDSGILTGLVMRTFRRGKNLHKFGISAIGDRRFPGIIKSMRELSKGINFTVRKPGSKAKRKKLYRQLLKEARSAHKGFKSELKKVRGALSSVNIKPSQYIQLERVIVWMEADVESLDNVMGYCSQRINADEITPSKDKTLSLSDQSVGFIKKGDREAVIGYKPQIGRSKNGFIPAFKVPEGNAADSSEFLPIAKNGINRTGIIPGVISCDDGYSNRVVRDYFLERGVKVVSISGSKGKKIIGQEDWESEEYVEVRNNRSAVESLMFTIKYGFNFGKVMRRGIENVRAELLEKVLAYNFCRMVEVRKWPRERVA
jgi:IS5 family transposase